MNITQPAPPESSNNTGKIVGAVIGVAAGLLLIGFGLDYYRRNAFKNTGAKPDSQTISSIRVDAPGIPGLTAGPASPAAAGHRGLGAGAPAAGMLPSEPLHKAPLQQPAGGARLQDHLSSGASSRGSGSDHASSVAVFFPAGK